MAKIARKRKPVEPPATPLAALLEKHLEDLRVRNYSEYTVKNRRVHIGFFLDWAYELGLVLTGEYFGARYMSSAQGRFTSPDSGNITAFLYPDDPQSWNAYAYGRNNPLSYVDPTGKSYQICDANGKNCAKDQLTDDEFASEKKAAQANGEIFNNNGTLSHTDANGNKIVDGTYRQTDVDLPGDAATNRAAAGFIVASFNNAMTEFGKNAAYAATGTLALRGLGFAAEAMGTEHNTLVAVRRRRLTEQEAKWIQDVVLANPEWADVNLGELYVVKQCICGCRTVVFEEPGSVQNPRVAEHQDLVGEIDLHVQLDNGTDNYISVLLHHSWGKLTYLEVVWYEFPEPVPSHWTELGREVRVTVE